MSKRLLQNVGYKCKNDVNHCSLFLNSIQVLSKSNLFLKVWLQTADAMTILFPRFSKYQHLGSSDLMTIVQSLQITMLYSILSVF